MRHKLAHAIASMAVLSLMAVGIAVASTPGPAYLSVVRWKAVSKSKSTGLLSVTTKATIPRHPDAFIRPNAVVGFGWVDAQTNKAFVATIHPVLGRDSTQNPRAWHAHTVTLTSGATAPNDFCLGSIASTPTVGLSIHGATMRINVRASTLPVPAAAFDLATGFTVQADAACASGLGVRVST
ncbi:MAG: hypothetical protein E6G11_00430 [Actinobacteria bacterium]|nr:MAG: hypothetical protein E6G11_00430 [Actinomycetota bacterium]